MEAWKILLIVLLSTAAAGVLGGFIIGKIMTRDKNRPSLLSLREKIIYSFCILLGLSFILIGVFAKPAVSTQGELPAEENLYGDGFTEGDGIAAQNGGYEGIAEPDDVVVF